MIGFWKTVAELLVSLPAALLLSGAAVVMGVVVAVANSVRWLMEVTHAIAR